MTEDMAQRRIVNVWDISGVSFAMFRVLGSSLKKTDLKA